MQLNVKEIQEILPHRYPFLLLDVVDELEPGVKAVARKNVTMNEPFFQGHFPGEPVMPGVLILEALAQAGAVAILCKDEYRGKIAYFGGMEHVKFRQMVIPGDVLRLEVEVLKWKGGKLGEDGKAMGTSAGMAKGTAWVGDRKAAEAELMVAVR